MILSKTMIVVNPSLVYLGFSGNALSRNVISIIHNHSYLLNDYLNRYSWARYSLIEDLATFNKQKNK